MAGDVSPEAAAALAEAVAEAIRRDPAFFASFVVNAHELRHRALLAGRGGCGPEALNAAAGEVSAQAWEMASRVDAGAVARVAAQVSGALSADQVEWALDMFRAGNLLPEDEVPLAPMHGWS